MDLIQQALQLIQQGGIPALLMIALAWLARDRQRLIDENKQKDEKLEQLAIHVITIATELRNYLFNERKS